MLIVRQNKFGECVAACCAMLTGESLDIACSEMRLYRDNKNRPFYPTSEAIKFLAARGFCYGMAVVPPKLIGTEIEDFEITIALTAAPAVVTVNSKTCDDCHHCVVFDPVRRMILDPLYDEPQPLEDYELLEWVYIGDVRETLYKPDVCAVT